MALMDRAQAVMAKDPATPDGTPQHEGAEAPAMEAQEDMEGEGGFTRPDVSKFVPEEMRDAVERVVAAGLRMMTDPQMREKVMAEIQNELPTPEKLSMAVTGLLLTLDSKAKGGGIPVEALFPAGMELLAEAGEMLQATGKPVTQEDFNDAARRMYVLIGKKLGVPDEQLMQGAEQAAGGQQAQPAPQGPQPMADDGWED